MPSTNPGEKPRRGIYVLGWRGIGAGAIALPQTAHSTRIAALPVMIESRGQAVAYRRLASRWQR